MSNLTQKDDSRFVLRPTRLDLWGAYKKQEASFWTAEEIDLEEDKTDWEKLTSGEQFFIKNVLAFFAASDGIVGENLSTRFYGDVGFPEARAFYGYQLMIEQIHGEVYTLLIESFVKDQKEKDHLFNAIVEIPIVKKKADWGRQWISSEASFEERLVAFAAVEGIFFSSSFCSIYWLKKRGLMPGLSFSNELIATDEGAHTEFACLLYSYSDNKPSQERVLQIINSAVEIEKIFATDSLPVSLIGMNSLLMQQYIEFVADRLLQSLGYERYYKVANPFDFMEIISLVPKSNSFEKRSKEYSKAGVMCSSEIRFNEEF